MDGWRCDGRLMGCVTDGWMEGWGECGGMVGDGVAAVVMRYGLLGGCVGATEGDLIL